MPEGQVLEFSGLTKRFGAVQAVSQLSARVEPGMVTGFLGPNGAGKTTTLRILLGLVRADEGTARIGGADYRTLGHPLRTVGAVLEASSFHPGRSAANHLKTYAQAAGLPVTRVDEVLGLVGLADTAGRKVGGYSLGMRQRLGLAYALLGDPGVLVLDEPTNGLDPEGIKWLRGFLRELAREGRTVLVSSHLLTEVQQTVDAVLIIAHGRGVFQGGLHELTDPSEFATVVDSPDRGALTGALRDADLSFEVLRSGLTVRGADPAAVGLIAAAAGVPLSALQRRGPALEEVFLDLVNGVRVHEKVPGAPSEAVVGGGVGRDDSVEAVATGGVGLDAPVETVAAGGVGLDSPVEPGSDTDAAAESADDVSTANDVPAHDAESSRGHAPDGTPAPNDVEAPTDVGPRSTGVFVAGEEIEAAAGSSGADESADDAARAESSTTERRGETPTGPELAAFAVASTGVIDIVGGAELADRGGGRSDAAEPDTAQSDAANLGETVPDRAGPDDGGPGTAGPDDGGPGTAGPDGAGSGTARPGDGPDGAGSDAARQDSAGDDDHGDSDREVEETVDSVDAPEVEASDRPWESSEKTEADLDADLFFAAFDEDEDGDDAAEAEPDRRQTDGDAQR